MGRLPGKTCGCSLWNVPPERAKRETLSRSALVQGRRVGGSSGGQRSGLRAGNEWVCPPGKAQSLPLECPSEGATQETLGSSAFVQSRRDGEERESAQRLEVGNLWVVRRETRSRPSGMFVRESEARNTGSLCPCSRTPSWRTMEVGVTALELVTSEVARRKRRSHSLWNVPSEGATQETTGRSALVQSRRDREERELVQRLEVGK